MDQSDRSDSANIYQKAPVTIVEGEHGIFLWYSQTEVSVPFARIAIKTLLVSSQSPRTNSLAPLSVSKLITSMIHLKWPRAGPLRIHQAGDIPVRVYKYVNLAYVRQTVNERTMVQVSLVKRLGNIASQWA